MSCRGAETPARRVKRPRARALFTFRLAIRKMQLGNFDASDETYRGYVTDSHDGNSRRVAVGRGTKGVCGHVCGRNPTPFGRGPIELSFEEHHVRLKSWMTHHSRPISSGLAFASAAPLRAVHARLLRRRRQCNGNLLSARSIRTCTCSNVLRKIARDRLRNAVHPALIKQIAPCASSIVSSRASSFSVSATDLPSSTRCCLYAASQSSPGFDIATVSRQILPSLSGKFDALPARNTDNSSGR